MAMTPTQPPPSAYEILGVPPDADEATIKQAYRQQAAKHHPDKGGNAEQFLGIQQAYDVLSHEDRRAHYDRTGQTTAADLDKEAKTTLAKTLMQFMEKGSPQDDFVHLTRGFIRKKLSEGDQQIRNLKGKIKHWQKVRRRIKFKAPKAPKAKAGAKAKAQPKGDDFVTPVINRELTALGHDIKTVERGMEIGSRMLALLDQIEYQTHDDKPTPPKPILTLADLFGTNSSKL